MVPTSRILEIYHAVKFTYSSSYDYFKYRGKLKNKYDGEHSRYYPQLLKIQKNFKTEEEVSLHFSNMVCNDVFITLSAQDNHINSTKQIIVYMLHLESKFRDDIKELFDESVGFEALTLLVKESIMNAPILDMFISGKIDFVLFNLLDSVMEFTRTWRSPVWKLYEKKLMLQGRFLYINNSHKLRCAKILKEYLTH